MSSEFYMSHLLQAQRLCRLMRNKQSTYSWVGEQTGCRDDKKKGCGKAAVEDGRSMRREQNQRRENKKKKWANWHLEWRRNCLCVDWWMICSIYMKIGQINLAHRVTEGTMIPTQGCNIIFQITADIKHRCPENQDDRSQTFIGLYLPINRHETSSNTGLLLNIIAATIVSFWNQIRSAFFYGVPQDLCVSMSYFGGIFDHFLSILHWPTMVKPNTGTKFMYIIEHGNNHHIIPS